MPPNDKNCQFPKNAEEYQKRQCSTFDRITHNQNKFFKNKNKNFMI